MPAADLLRFIARSDAEDDAPAFHAGDPSTTVVFGGPAYNDTDWIRRAYAAGAHGSFDAMATHPYLGIADEAPETPDDGTMWTLTHVAAVHRLMAANGDGDKPIWFTEFGWSSHTNAGLDLNDGADNWLHGVSAQQQADYLIRAIQLVQKDFPYVTHMFWYCERNVATDNVQNANYGLLTHDLQPKPAYTALQSFLAQPDATTPAATGASPPPVANGAGRAAGNIIRIGSALRITVPVRPMSRRSLAPFVRRSPRPQLAPLPVSYREPTRRM